MISVRFKEAATASPLRICAYTQKDQLLLSIPSQGVPTTPADSVQPEATVSTFAGMGMHQHL